MMRRISRTLLAGLFTALGLGCDGLLAPEPARLRQDLQLIAVAPPRASVEGGFLTVVAAFELPGAAIRRDDRVEAQLSSSRGDLESVPLGPRWCIVSGGRMVVCDEFYVQLREGATSAQLSQFAVALNVRMRDEGFGFVSFHAFGSWDEAMAMMRSHPAVASVDYTPISLLGDGPAVAAFDHTIAQDRGPVRQRDGKISVELGDALTLQVRNADGTHWSQAHVVP